MSRHKKLTRSKNEKILIVVCFNLLICSSVFANIGFYNTKISAITTHNYWNALIIEFKIPVADGEKCGISNAVILQKNYYMFKEMYAAFLSSFHGQTMISGSVNGCSGSYPILTRLDVRKQSN